MTVKSNNIIVLDTSVLLDICYSDLFDSMSMLDYDWITTDLAFNELQIPEPTDNMISKIEIASVQLNELNEVKVLYPNISIEDCSVLLLSKQRNAILLTGDMSLRKIADREEIEIHGALWLLDMLLSKDIINNQRASSALTIMLENGARLPQDECKKRLNLWE